MTVMTFFRLFLVSLTLGLTFPVIAGESIMHSDPYSEPSGLQQALIAALAYNPAAKGQQIQLDAQSDAIDAAKAGWYPSLSGSVNTEDDSARYLELDQPLWSFGKISSSIEIEQVTLVLEQQNLRQIRRDLMEKTALAYTQVLSARLKIIIAKENLAEHQRLYQRIQRRQKGLIASKADVNLAQSRWLQAQADLLSYEASLQAALNELFALTRVVVPADIKVSPALTLLAGDEEVKRLALEHASAVAQARVRVNLAKAQLEQQKAAPFPTLSVNVQQYLFDYYDNETRVGLQLKGSVSGMGVAAYNQIQGAEKSIIAARYELDSVRNETKRKTENLLVSRALQQGLLESQKQSVEALSLTMESFLRQYETNRKTWVEVLNQQRELSNMRYSLVNTDQQYTALSLQIAIMTGQLDELAGVKP